MVRLLPLFLVFGCGAPALDNLPREYVRDLNDLGYTAVYPPRADFRVGYAFFRMYDRSDPLNPLARERVFLGQVPILMQSEARNALTRPALTQTVASGEQNDFDRDQSGRGALRGPDPEDMAPVAFPVVTAYGGGVFGIPGLGLGNQSSVYIEFENARRSAVEINSAALFAHVQRTVHHEFCPNVQVIARLAQGRGVNCANLVGFAPFGSDQDRFCDIVVVTEALYTRTIDYTVSNARGLNAGVGARPGGSRADVNLDVNLDGEDQSADELSAAIAGILQASQPTDEGFGASAATGTQFGFRQDFNEPVAFAFDGVTFEPNGTCGFQ